MPGTRPRAPTARWRATASASARRLRRRAGGARARGHVCGAGLQPGRPGAGRAGRTPSCRSPACRQPNRKPLPPPAPSLSRPNRPSGGGGGSLLLVPAHSQHHTFSDVPVIIEGSASARRLLSLMRPISPQPVSAAASLRLICDAVVTFLRAHYADCGRWPAAGGGASAGGRAGSLAAAGSGAGAGGFGAKDGEGALTDEAEEMAAEAHAGQGGGGGGGPVTWAAARSAGRATAAAAAAAGPAPLPPAAHVPVAAAEAAAYAPLQEQGLLRILEVYE
jgi:hypothetical protein